MKSILEIIRKADRGQLLTDAEQHLSDIANAIEKHGGGTGEITVTIKVTAKAEGAYEFKTTMKAKIPEPDRLSVLLFRDEDSGEFQREDPRQPDFPIVHEADFANGRRRPPETQENE